MAATGRFIHAPEDTTAVAFTNAYNASLKLSIDLYSSAPATAPQQRRARVRLSGIYILGAIASSATKLTIKGYTSADGTGLAVIPETEATLTTAITGTNGTASWGVDAAASVAYDTATDSYTVTPLTGAAIDCEITQGAKTGSDTNFAVPTVIGVS